MRFSTAIVAFASAALATPTPDPEATAVDVAKAEATDTISLQSYLNTCSECRGINGLDEHYTIGCRCQNTAGSYTYSELRISDYIHNDDGNMRWGGSSFQKTCPNVFTGGLLNIILQGNCRTKSGSTGFTSINMNERVHNNNGRLYYAA